MQPVKSKRNTVSPFSSQSVRNAYSHINAYSHYKGLFRGVGLLWIIGLALGLALTIDPLILQQNALAASQPGQPWLSSEAPQDSALQPMAAQETSFAQWALFNETLPPALAVSRVQSDYQLTNGSTIVVTYTVTNQQFPADPPEIPAGLSSEDVLALLADYNLVNDPNTIHNVLLRLQTDLPYTFLPDETGGQPAAQPSVSPVGVLAWDLGALPPQASQTVVVAFDASSLAGINDFTPLDDGAAAWGSLGGRMVTAQAYPAQLAPPSVGDWLQWTVDADRYDPEMLNQAALLGQDPLRIFAYVQSLGYEVYTGSLRGTRGTLWSQAGNSTDLSSLLVAMLRASGIPARYRHGELSPTQAAQLVDSMFPQPTRFTGYVPAGQALSSPQTDPSLLAEASDHWWVEAYLPGQGWTNLDPSFSNAAVGQQFATPLPASDRLAELPDAIRHKITIALEVEDYHPLNAGFGGLRRTLPLSQTFNTVELTGKPVALAHLVESKPTPGLVFTAISHKYTPYLLVGEREIIGETYQELFTNFPLGTIFRTGAWLKFTVLPPGGPAEYFERELVDKIGAEARWTGATLGIKQEGSDALFTDSDIYTTWFWPNLVPAYALEQAQARTLNLVDEINADLTILQTLYPKTNRTAAEDAQLRQVRARFQSNMASYLGNIGIAFGELADRNLVESGEGLFVKAYYAAPRIVTTSVEPDDQGALFSMDLRKTGARAIPYPGQVLTASVTFNIVKGIVESGMEGVVLEANTGQQAVTTAWLFSQAAEQDIPSWVVTYDNLDALNTLGISEQGKARIIQALVQGKFVVVPGQAVAVQGSVETYTGWWEVDPLTGETIGVMDNGLHMAALEYIADIGAVAGPFVDFMLGFTSYALGFVAYHVDKAIGSGTFDLPGYLTTVGNASRGLACLTGLSGIYAGVSCAGGLDLFGDGQKAAEQYFSRVVTADPPLPEQFQAMPLRDLSQPVVVGVVSAPAVYPAGPLDLALETSFMQLTGAGSAAFRTEAAPAAFSFQMLNLAEGDLYDAQGNLLEQVSPSNGSLLAIPEGGAFGSGQAYLLAEASNLSDFPVSLELGGDSGEIGVSLYAPAVDGLGGGSSWGPFSAQVGGDAPSVFTIAGADVTAGGRVYSAADYGPFRVETTSAVALAGSGPGAAPLFSPAGIGLALTLDNNTLIFGPAAGSGLVGATPLDPAALSTNGLALAAFSGEVLVEEQNAGLDSYTLAGPAAFFTLALDPAQSAPAPLTAASFTLDLAANFAGSYTVTVTAPEGWFVELTSSGEVQALPPIGAAPGEYPILVVVQSVEYPALFLSAVHTVTLAPYEGLDLAVQPEPLITVPMGGDQPAQVPDAAYTIILTNTSSSAYTYTLEISGLPDDWALLSLPGSSITLPAGGVGVVGLYVAPPISAGLPPAGTTYPIQVAAESNTGLIASDSIVFTMPAVPFANLALDPQIVTAVPGGLAGFTLTLENIGNAVGNFTLQATLPGPDWALAAPLNSPVALAAGQTSTQQGAVQLPTGVSIGAQYRVDVEVESGPTDSFTLLVYSESALSVQQAAENAAGACSLGGGAAISLSAGLSFLGTALNDLEASCQDGDCDPGLQTRVVSALNALAAIVETTYPLNAAATLDGENLAQALSDLAAEFANAADPIGEAKHVQAAELVAELENSICTLAAHRLDVMFVPASLVALENSSLPLALQVTNRGSLTTTALLTLTLPAGVSADWAEDSLTLAPGQTASLPITLQTSALGQYLLQAEFEALEWRNPGVSSGSLPPGLTQANLAVLDAFLRVGQVLPTPSFVETGAGVDVMVLADLINQTNLPMSTQAVVELLGPGGVVSDTLTQSLDILSASVPVRLNLGAFETASLPAGVYTVTVAFTDDQGDLIPYASSYGLLGVGVAIEASASVYPAVVPPGDWVVTTTIQTSLSPAVLTALAPRSVPVETAEAAEIVQQPIVHQPAGLALRAPGSAETLISSGASNQLSAASNLEAAASNVGAALPSLDATASSLEVAAVALLSSTITVTSPHLADGQDAALVEVVARDASLNPLSGVLVWLAATGSDNHFAPISGTTNISGVFTATLTSTFPEVKRLSAVLGDGASAAQFLGPVWVDFTGASLQGSLFSDANANNLQEPGEAGLGGVAVSLYDAASGVLVRATATDAQGVYTLTHLLPGQYRLEPAALVEFAYSGSQVLTQTLAAHDVQTGLDFGLYTVARVSGQVWNDLDQDGQRDFGEGPLAGALVSAYDDSQALAASQFTGADGQYAFALPADLPTAPQNFVFNGGPCELSCPGPLPLFEPDTARVVNGDFSLNPAQPLDPAFFPSNYDFSTGDLTGWSASGAAVTVVSDTFNLDGPYLRLNAVGTYADSSAFTVPAGATALQFNYYNWTNRNAAESVPLTVYLLTGAGFSVSINLGTYQGTANQGWRTAVVDLQTYQGQVVKLRIASDTDGFRAGRARVDNFWLVDAVPGWSAANMRYTQVVSDGYNLDGAHLYFSLFDQYVRSAPLTIPPGTQSLRFNYWSYTAASSTANGPFTVYLLSGPDYATQTLLGSFSSSFVQGWQTGVIDIRAYQGQTVRLRFNTDTNNFGTSKLRLDNIFLAQEVPGWDLSDARNIFISAWDNAENQDSGVYSPANTGFEEIPAALAEPDQVANPNFDSSPVPLDPGLYPANYDFSSGLLDGGWTASNINATVVSDTYNTAGPYLRLNATNIYADSPVFLVADDAVSLRFTYYAFTNRSAVETAPLSVYVLTGEGYAVSTLVGQVWGSRNHGWQQAQLDLSAFAGQVIRLRFNSDTDGFRSGRAFVDNLSLWGGIPGWTVSDARVVDVFTPDVDEGSGPYLLLDAHNQAATSDPLVLPACDAASLAQGSLVLTFRYFNWAPRNALETSRMDVFVLSGSDYSLSTNVGTFWGSFNDGWQTGRVDLSAFACAADPAPVRLRFQSDSDGFRAGRSRLDQLSLSPAVPGWAVGDARFSWPALPGAEVPGLPGELPNPNFDAGWGALPLLGAPDNPDFDLGRSPLPTASYPANYDFSSGDLGGWTVSSASVSVVEDASSGLVPEIEGPYLLFDAYNQTATSPIFMLPDDAQSVRFWYLNWTNRSATEQVPLNVYVLNGANFETSTLIGVVYGSQEDGWKEGRLDLAAFVGQPVRLRFQSDTNGFRAGRARLDSLSLNSEVPGWTLSSAEQIVIQPSGGLDGPFVWINQRGQYIEQTLQIPADAQRLQFSYFAWTERNPDENVPVFVQVLPSDEAGSAIVTEGTFYGSLNSGWHTVSADLTAFQGQTVTLRLASDSDGFRAGKAYFDRLSFERSVPGWEVSNGELVGLSNEQAPPGSGVPGTGSHLLLDAHRQWAATPPFRLGENVSAITFDYLAWTERNPAENTPMYLEVLTAVYPSPGSEDLAFGVVTRVGTANGSRNLGWQEATFDLSDFRGRVIRLRLASDSDGFRAGKAWVDNLRFETNAPGPGGWVDSNPAGAFLLLNRNNLQADSAPFFVLTDTQSVQFAYLAWNQEDGDQSIPLTVYALAESGPVQVATQLGQVTGAWVDGWKTATLDLSAFRGRVIRLRFASDTNSFRDGRAAVDAVTLLAGAPGAALGSLTPPGGNFMRLSQPNLQATSSEINVPIGSPYLHFDYFNSSTNGELNSIPLVVRVLSGPDYATVTILATLNSRGVDGWRQAALNLGAFQGQTIRLRFESSANSFSGAYNLLDNVYLAPASGLPPGDLANYTIEEINPPGFTSSTPDSLEINVAAGLGQLGLDFGDYRIDRYLSSLEAAPAEVTADGVESAVVTVTLRAGDGSPLAGYAVELLASGSELLFEQPAALTDAFGQAVGRVRSTFAPQVALVSARTLEDGVTLAAAVPVTFTPGLPDVDMSGLEAAPPAVVANGVDTAVYTVTLRDAFGNLVPGVPVEMMAIPDAATTLTVTAALTLTNAAGQVTGTLAADSDAWVSLWAYLPGQAITLTQGAQVRFSRVDPLISTVIATPDTALANGADPIVLTVTLLDSNSQPLPGRPVTLAGAPGLAALPLTNAAGVVTATLTSETVGPVTIQAWGDGILLAAQAVLTFTVGPVDPDASTLVAVPQTVIADGVSAATLTAHLVDSFGHPIAGKTVQFQAEGLVGSAPNPPSAVTDAGGIAQSSLASAQIGQAQVWAVVAGDLLTLTQQAAVAFVPGPADLAASTVVITPTAALADGIETVTISATLRDASGHLAANRQVQLVLSGGANTVLPGTLANTDASGQVQFSVRSSVVGERQVGLTDLAYGANLVLGSFEFIVGPVDPDASRLTVSKPAVFVGPFDQATVTALLLDAYGHPVPGKSVLIQSSVPLTLTQASLLTDADGKVSAVVQSSVVQTATFTAFNQTDTLTLTEQASITFIAGPASAVQSTFGMTPLSLVADNIQTAVITATLRDAAGNPLVNRWVQLLVSGSSNRVLPSASQNTNHLGQVTYSLASAWAEIKSVSLRDVSGNVTLAVGQIEFLPGDLDPARSTLTAKPGRAAADGISQVTLTIQALDALGNPLAGLPVEIYGASAGITLIQPAAPTDALGYATASLTSTVPVTAVLQAGVDGILLTSDVTVLFEPVYAFSFEIFPVTPVSEPGRSEVVVHPDVGVGGAANFTLRLVNTGYLPDSYTLSLVGLDPAWVSGLDEPNVTLPAGGIWEQTIAIQPTGLADVCQAVGSYPFSVDAAAAAAPLQSVPAQVNFVSNPVISNLLPGGGTGLGGTTALFRWQTSVDASGTVFLRPLGATEYTQYPGSGGTIHQVSVSDLERNTVYEWYATSESDCGSESSAVRTFEVLNGVVFTMPQYTFELERDYNQIVSLNVFNQDVISHTIVITLENPSDELIIGFLGEGSIDAPFVLQPGQTHSMDLAIHAQDVTQEDFILTARLEATNPGRNGPIEHSVPIHIHIEIPYFDFSLEQVSFDPLTLATTYKITNHGDPLTDLAVTSAVTGTDASTLAQVFLMPSMVHGYLKTGQSFTFTAYPALDSGFQSLSGTITASAGGVFTQTAINLALPPGTSMYLGEVENVSLESTTADWYCTNRPVIHNNFTLPPGFRRADVARATFYMNINADRSWKNVLPHDVELLINGSTIGKLVNVIPTGLYTFPIDPDFLNEALAGPSANRITVSTTHLNGGHYVVASDMTVSICMNTYREWVAATSQAEADQLVLQRSYLIPAPTTLDVEVLSPAPGETLTANLPVNLKIRVDDDVLSPLFYTVIAEADNGDGTVLLFDDGRHDDGGYKDGIYAGTWTPLTPGPVTLTIGAESCTITGQAVISLTVGALDYAVEITHAARTAGAALLEASIAPPAALLPAPPLTEVSWPAFHLGVVAPGEVESTAAHVLAQTLEGLAPGEVRRVAEGTRVRYTGPSGAGELALPPLYVTAERMLSITPPVHSVSPSGSVVYTVTLTRPGPAGDQPTLPFTLTLAGLPAGWASPLPEVHLSGGETVHMPLTVTVPAGEALAAYPFSVAARSGSVTDQAGALLLVESGLTLAIHPPLQTALPGQPVEYTLALSGTAGDFTLDMQGLTQDWRSSLPAQVSLAPGELLTLPFTLTGYSPAGARAFTISAQPSGAPSPTPAASAGAIVFLQGEYRAGLAILPPLVTGGPGVTALYTLTLTNLGSLADTYTLEPTLPVGWDAALLVAQSSQPVGAEALTLLPGASTQLLLLVTPPAGTQPGSYPIVVEASSPSSQGARVEAVYEVGGFGVSVQIDPAERTLDGRAPATWTVTVTNLGSQPGTFDVFLTGVPALSGRFAASGGPTAQVTLSVGQSQALLFTASDFSFLAPGPYPFEAVARLVSNPAIASSAAASLTLTGFHGLEVALDPPAQVTELTENLLTLVVTNTGSLASWYTVDLFAPGSQPPALPFRVYLPILFSNYQNPIDWPDPTPPNFISVYSSADRIYLPAGAVARIPVVVMVGPYSVDEPNAYFVQAHVTADSGLEAETEATLVVQAEFPLKVYLPMIMR